MNHYSPLLGIIAFLFLVISTTLTYAECGIASTYGEGTRTATGERYNPWGITAAHRTRKMGSHVRVRNMRTGKEIELRINDYGPAAWTHRIIDLSLGAARALGVSGLAFVCID